MYLKIKKSIASKENIFVHNKRKKDDKFKIISKRHNIKLFRSSKNNVAKRLLDCAIENSIDTIVRITADCPIIDPKLIDKCIKLHFSKNSDYTSNTLKLSFPDGLDVEVINTKTLIKSQRAEKISIIKNT